MDPIILAFVYGTFDEDNEDNENDHDDNFDYIYEYFHKIIGGVKSLFYATRTAQTK